MQLTLFEPARTKRTTKTYHDDQGKFCSKEKAWEKKLNEAIRERDMWYRAYAILVKQYNEEKRNAQHPIKHGNI